MIDGFSRGHLPPSGASAVREAIATGMKVVITSARVYPTHEYPDSFADLTANGVVGGQDLDAKKARILLAC